MTASTWAKFIDLHARGDRNVEIARKIGIDASTISRWRKDGNIPEPQAVVDFANAYSLNPIAALIAAGHLTQDSVGIYLSAPADLSEITTPQLLDELYRRLAELRETFTVLEQSSDQPAIEAIVEALRNRHLPPVNVVRLDDHRVAEDRDDDAAIVAESLADLHAAYTSELDPDIENTADPHA